METAKFGLCGGSKLRQHAVCERRSCGWVYCLDCGALGDGQGRFVANPTGVDGS